MQIYFHEMRTEAHFVIACPSYHPDTDMILTMQKVGFNSLHYGVSSSPQQLLRYHIQTARTVIGQVWIRSPSC